MFGNFFRDKSGPGSGFALDFKNKISKFLGPCFASKNIVSNKFHSPEWYGLFKNSTEQNYRDQLKVFPVPNFYPDKLNFQEC